MEARTHILMPAFRADPYPSYAAMRRDTPVVQVEPGGIWAVSRHEDVSAILKDPARFSSQGFRVAWEPEWVGYNPVAHSLLALDGAEHGRLRGIVGQAFGTRAIHRLEPKLRALIATLTEDLAAGEVEFNAAFGLPLPAFAIGELIGVDPADRHHFRRWADDITSVGPVPESPEHATRVRATIAELNGYLEDVIARRRAEPREDLVSDLLRAEADGQRLTDAELISFLVVLLLGGFDTTTHLLANALRVLADRPDVWADLKADQRLIPGFVEEVLRWDPPVHGIPRIAMTEVQVAGVTIPAGSLVLLLLGSANRDERRFPDPDRFDHRRGGPNVAFGHGLHTCIGAGLARMEARIALEAIVQRFERVEITDRNLVWNRAITTRGVDALRVRFS